jgi:hypothetical protein
MAIDLFKAHCSVRGWIFQFIWGWNISRLFVVAGGGVSVEHSGNPSSMEIELYMNLILIVCTPIYMMGEGKAVG